jgi:hypothetical protein
MSQHSSSSSETDDSSSVSSLSSLSATPILVRSNATVSRGVFPDELEQAKRINDAIESQESDSSSSIDYEKLLIKDTPPVWYPCEQPSIFPNIWNTLILLGCMVTLTDMNFFPTVVAVLTIGKLLTVLPKIIPTTSRSLAMLAASYIALGIAWLGVLYFLQKPVASTIVQPISQFVINNIYRGILWPGSLIVTTCKLFGAFITKTCTA